MTRSKRNILIFFIGGFVAVLLGAFFGLLIGALFGGVLTAIVDLPKIYGGLPGYEGTGALGSVIAYSQRDPEIPKGFYRKRSGDCYSL